MRGGRGQRVMNEVRIRDRWAGTGSVGSGRDSSVV